MNSFDWYVKLRWSNSLEKYNFWSIISLGITPILGFLFWIICAKKYEDQSLGIAITIIGLANIIALVSRLGMDEGLKRYKYNQIKLLFLKHLELFQSFNFKRFNYTYKRRQKR